MKASKKHIEYLKDYEVFYLKAYRGEDSQSLTIGYGHVILKNSPYDENTILTEKQAEELLKRDLKRREDYVNQQAQNYKLRLNQHQFDGLLDMVLKIPMLYFMNSQGGIK